MKFEEKLQSLRRHLVGKTIVAVESSGDGWIIRDYKPAKSLNDIEFRLDDGTSVKIDPEADGGIIARIE